ncbi:hypothetical protein J6590_097749 [Homalodisca vitripennis]|nr:hypothetical protein J6590_097749 [Homalodisca vitripennis]
MDDLLRSDEVRDILLEPDIDDDCSVHESDIESNIGEEFENELRAELGDDYERCRYDDLVITSITEDESLVEENTFNPIQEELAAVGEDVETDELSWRQWNTNDPKFKKFVWAGNSGYKPPQWRLKQTPGGTKTIIIQIIKARGEDISQKETPRHPAGNVIGRCWFCDRKKNRKTKTQCDICGVHLCREHTKTLLIQGQVDTGQRNSKREDACKREQEWRGNLSILSKTVITRVPE